MIFDSLFQSFILSPEFQTFELGAIFFDFFGRLWQSLDTGYIQIFLSSFVCLLFKF